MSKKEEDDYYAIMVDSIRPDVVIPFDCYILLMYSKRLLLWVHEGDAFPQKKYKKLKARSIEKLYIRPKHKEAYFAYLESFLRTPEGAAVLKELEAKGEVEGMPQPDEYYLNLTGEIDIQDDLRLDDTPVEVEETTEVMGEIETQEEEGQNFGNLDIEEEPEESSEDTKPVEVVAVDGEKKSFGSIQLEDVDGPFGEVLKSLQTEVLELTEKFTVKGNSEEPDDDQIIEDCTLIINEELTKVSEKSRKGHLDVELIENATLKIDDQLQIIRGKNFDDPEGVIKTNMGDIDQKVADLRACIKDGKLNPRRVRKTLNYIKMKVDKIKAGSKKDPNILFSSSMNRMLKGVEEKLGQRLALSSEHGEYDEIPDYISDKLDMDDVMNASGEDIKRFQHQIIKQNLMIQDLTRKYKGSRKSLKGLRDKWFLFQIHAKKSLSGSDLIAAKDIDKEFQGFNEEFSDSKNDYENLMSVARGITQEMGGEEIKVDPELLAEIGALSEEEQKRLRAHLKAGLPEKQKEATEPTEDSEESDTLKEARAAAEDDTEDGEMDLSDLLMSTGRVQAGAPAATVDNELLEQLQSENDILKVQLENSQKLIEVTNNKISELEGLIEKNNELTSTLEEENKGNRKMIETLEEKVERFQSSEDMYQDTMGDAHKEAKIAKSDFESQTEMIKEMRNELALKDAEITTLKKGAKFEDLAKAKDERLKELTRSLTNKQEEASSLRKEHVKVVAKMTQEQQKFKHMSHKLDRLKGEYEAQRKQIRSTEAKYEMNKNALKQSRKAIDKLTHLSDQLRSDRQKYIRQTNEVMAKYKTMTSAANTLNRQVAADGKIVEQLEKQIQKAKQIEEQLREQISDWRKKYAKEQQKLKDLEKDIRAGEIKKAS